MGGFAPSPAFDANPSERNAWMKRAACPGLPDPPVIVDFSSQQDGWSMTQPPLVLAAQIGKLPLILCWGPFGHPSFAKPISQHPICEAALAFPWLEIRKNEAYPVFTKASSDQRCPWLNTPADFDDAGQMNAYFRWENIQDTPSEFIIRLWIGHPPVRKAISMPKTAITDVTLRRLQKFMVKTGGNYSWRILQNGQELVAGKISPNDVNLLTIPRITLTVDPVELSVYPVK
jgi:hypothetical protein